MRQVFRTRTGFIDGHGHIQHESLEIVLAVIGRGEEQGHRVVQPDIGVIAILGAEQAELTDVQKDGVFANVYNALFSEARRLQLPQDWSILNFERYSPAQAAGHFMFEPEDMDKYGLDPSTRDGRATWLAETTGPHPVVKV